MRDLTGSSTREQLGSQQREQMPFARIRGAGAGAEAPVGRESFVYSLAKVFGRRAHVGLQRRGATTFGSSRTLLLAGVALGRNMAERLEAVDVHATSWYDARLGSRRLLRIMVPNLRIDGWAEIHGPNAKAANTRATTPLFAAIVEQCPTAPTPRGEAARTGARKLAELDEAFYSLPIFRSTGAIARARDIVATFGPNWMRLRE